MQATIRLAALMSLLLSVGVASAADAQKKVVLSGPATCEQCRIELEEVVVFGDSIGPGMLQEQSVIATDPRGRFYVTSNYEPTIAVFDANGRFLRRLGRQGQGPGEFTRRPTVLFGSSDTLYAIVGTARRMTVFSPDYKLVRTAPFSLSYATAVRLSDGRFLVSGASGTAETIGYPLHLVDQKGAYVRSFGSETGAHDLYAPRGTVVRRIAAPAGPTVWTSEVGQLVFQQWNLEGKQLAQITRRAPWFPPVSTERLPANATPGTHPDPPTIRSLSEDRSGLLWSLTTVPDREWRPRTLPPDPTGGGTYVPDSLRHKLLDSVLEVIDPHRGVVLATRTFDTLFIAFIAPGLLASFTEDAGGNPRYVVWRARLVSPASK